jgi:glutamate N-acetyltransferase/amino-acid N-acetyltransferase
LVKTAISGEDPNWGRIIMAVGKAGPNLNLKKLIIKFGDIMIIHNGKLSETYNETEVAKYMKNENIDISVEIFTGSKNFTVYTMDLTKEYIKINSDYRS